MFLTGKRPPYRTPEVTSSSISCVSGKGSKNAMTVTEIAQQS